MGSIIRGDVIERFELCPLWASSTFSLKYPLGYSYLQSCEHSTVFNLYAKLLSVIGISIIFCRLIKSGFLKKMHD